MIYLPYKPNFGSYLLSSDSSESNCFEIESSPEMLDAEIEEILGNLPPLVLGYDSPKRKQDTFTEVDENTLTEAVDFNIIKEGVDDNACTAEDNDKYLVAINSLNEFDLNDIFSDNKNDKLSGGKESDEEPVGVVESLDPLKEIPPIQTAQERKVIKIKPSVFIDELKRWNMTLGTLVKKLTWYFKTYWEITSQPL